MLRLFTFGKDDYSKKDAVVTIIKKGTPIEKMKKLLRDAFAKTPKKSIKKYAGILHTTLDPLEYQKQMRNEWE